MLLAGSATEPLPLWLDPGPELEDVLAGEGMLGMGDGLLVTLKERGTKAIYVLHLLQVGAIRPKQ